MKKIELTQGQYALVDDEDFDFLNQYSWHANKCGYDFYARGVVNGKIVRMHRMVMGFPKAKCVDHRDGNTLNNQKANLFACTTQQNVSHVVRLRKNSTSGHNGVYWDPVYNRWGARVVRHYKKIHLGLHKKKSDAIAARAKFDVDFPYDVTS